MKKVTRIFNLLFIFVLLCQASLFAQDDNDDDHNIDKEKKYEFVKKRSINKSYTVSNYDKLAIENSFGSVTVITWDKNEIKVDITIEVSANSETVAQKMLDRITVADQQKGKEITFRTTIKDANNSKTDKTTMSTNYVVSMPALNPLMIKNEFGSTIIPDYRGEIELTSKFGKLTTGNLSSVKNIDVEFGKATLGAIPGGSVNIKYSKATVSKLSGNVKMNIEFSNKVLLNLDNNLSNLDLKVSYSSVNLKPMADLPASYTISTSFGSFKNTTSVKFTSDEDEDSDHGPKFDHEYSGKSGSANVPVKIKSSFSNIVLGEATEEDMKEKNKDKEKRKKTVNI